MLFSIVTISYKSAHTIRATLDSVLQQEFRDFEYIVVDGNSQDGTAEILAEYEPKFNGRMRWVSEPDKGIGDAMNKGIRMAKGDYVAILNSDDNYTPDALKKMAAAIAATPGKDIYYGLVREYETDGVERILIRRHHSCLARGMTIHHPGCFIARTAHERVGYYNPVWRICGDFDMFMRFYRAGCTFLPVDAILVNYMGGGASASVKMNVETVRIRYQYGLMSRRAYWKSRVVLQLLIWRKKLHR